MMQGAQKLDRGYVICGYARTGSTLLASALQSTGKLGHPQEYFNPQAIALAEGEIYPTLAAAQCDEIARRGTTENGVYGLKVFCDQFDALQGFDWVSKLPNVKFIHLERRDALGQAISWVRALRSGQWTTNQPQHTEPNYNESAITEALTRFSYDRARWQMFFARNGIEPLWLVYEDMMHRLPETVAAVAKLVGVAGVEFTPQAITQLRPQRDALNDDWRDRYLAAQRDVTRLDCPTQQAVTLPRKSWKHRLLHGRR
jgi:trehalose 2-sulfotransferase